MLQRWFAWLAGALCLAAAAAPAQQAAPQPGADALPPQREADTLPQEAGRHGTVRPEVGDVVLADTVVHGEGEGRAPHQLLDLAGSAQVGFAAVWRDVRDGNAGLYFGRLDPQGRALEPERALYAHGSGSRELEPAIALAPGGHGAFTWCSSSTVGPTLHLRAFDAAGRLAPESTTLVQRKPDLAVRWPAIALAPGFGAVAWSENGALKLQRFRQGGDLLGAPLVLPGAPVSGPVRMCASQGGGDAAILCAWTTREGVRAAIVGLEACTPLPGLGEGVIERLVAHGADGAWWALVQGSAGHRLERIEAARPEERRTTALGFSPRDVCDLALRGGELLLGVQRPGGAIELCALDPRSPSAQPVPLPAFETGGGAAADLRLAGCGERTLVAWTGSFGRQSDVWWRILDEQEGGGVPRRWNTDESSTPQILARIASRGGSRAVVAWIDGRSGESQLMARWIDASGAFASEEIAIAPRPAGAQPPAALAGEPTAPSLALGADGGFLAVWKQAEKRGFRWLGQAFDARGAPQSGLLELDAGEDAPPAFKSDLEVAAFGAGYAVAYGKRDRGVFVRAVGPGGSSLGEPRAIFEHPLCQNPSLAELDGGGLAVAWDITVPGAGNRAVRGRVLDASLAAALPVFEPPLTIFGDDWDPALAPSAGGGFALAFTGGVQHGRDVFLRCFDAAGRVDGPLVPISSRSNEQDWPQVVRLEDGSLCVAFEDDLSAYDHAYVRRVRPQAGTASLGPIRTLNQREAILNETRLAPRIAPLKGGGFAAVWIDARRSKCTDVRVKILGPRFDAE